jgi:hypothetical protein
VKIKRGSTSVRRLIFIADTSQTNGAGLANLVFNSSGLVAYYIAGDLNNDVQITLVSATLGTFTSGGFVAVDNTNMPGWYEIGIPDAALDGGNEVAIQLRGATNMAPVNIYIELDAVDYQSATNFGLSKFTEIETDTQDIQNRLPSGLVDGRMASIAQVVGDKTSYKLASDGLSLVTAWAVAITGNLTGNVTGSVGSISGVTFPANFGSLGIDPSGSILLVGEVQELGAGALTANNAGDPIADIVWDEVLTGATHNIASSAGRRLRQLASVIVRAGTAQGSGTGNNQIQLDAGASATNGDYDPGLIFIETGTGAGQARLILHYNGSTKVATVDRDWRVNPDNTSEFVILADAGRNSVNEGLAQGGTSTTITLNASASSSDDAYNGQLVFIRSGTGQDQVGLVEDYVGSTKVATIRTRSATGQWATVPDTTSAYMMIPNLTFTLNEISTAVAATQALSRLDSMIESDGAGQFRFDTIALEMAPAGGGGGGTDWTANERTAIRSILGIPTSGTTPTDPSEGILDEIRDDINAIGINVYPVSASTPERVQGTTLTFYRNESRSVSVVTDFTLTSLTLQFTVEDADGVDVYTLANGSISRSGQTFTVAVTTAVTGNLGQYRWSMRDISGGGSSVVAMGVLTVQEAASNV